MPRVRTAKTLAQRIDLSYFRRLHGFRRWKLWLSIAVPLIAVVWLLGDNLVRKQHAYTSGPLSSSHAVFGDRCALCHVRSAGFRAHTSDKACLTCHDAPVHNQRQTFTPVCSSCHVEHQGRMRLAATADSGCVQCHGNLHTKDAQLRVDAHVSGFDHSHPQFAALRTGYVDPGTIKLNHYVHLQPTLRGPNGQVQMQCQDCHRLLNVNQPWPYSVAVVLPASQQPVSVPQTEAQQRKRRNVEAGAGPYMTPMRYVNQCAACHVLQFDPLIAVPAPHSKPEQVHAFIMQKLREYIAANPGAINLAPNANLPEDVEPGRNFLRPMGGMEERNIVRPTGPAAPRARSTEEWVQQRTAAAERLLWEKNCKLCHAATEGGGEGLPTSVKAVIPSRWFTRAEFDHAAHRMMACTSCHRSIPQSRQTSDINIPGIETCRACHQQGGPARQTAEGRCFECHSYHDWRQERPVNGKLDIAQLRGKGPSATPITGSQTQQPPARTASQPSDSSK